MTRTMLCENSLPEYFWAKTINTTCYVKNRILIRSLIKKTPYELWRGRRPNISYLHPFECECFILNTKDQLVKFDSKVDKGIFLAFLIHLKHIEFLKLELQLQKNPPILNSMMDKCQIRSYQILRMILHIYKQDCVYLLKKESLNNPKKILPQIEESSYHTAVTKHRRVE